MRLRMAARSVRGLLIAIAAMGLMASAHAQEKNPWHSTFISYGNNSWKLKKMIRKMIMKLKDCIFVQMKV